MQDFSHNPIVISEPENFLEKKLHPDGYGQRIYKYALAKRVDLDLMKTAKLTVRNDIAYIAIENTVWNALNISIIFSSVQLSKNSVLRIYNT